MKLVMGVLGSLLLAGGIGVAAGAEGMTENKSEENLPVVEVGLPRGGMFGLGGAYVIDKKLDRKNGFILKPRWAGVADTERLIAIGAIPVGLATSESAVRANMKGIKLRLLQPYMQPHQHVLVRKDSPYQDVMDLKGKSMATTREVTSQYNMFDFIMRQRGVDTEKDFELKKLGAAGIRAVLENGDVESGALWEAHVSKLLATGKYRVIFVFKDELAKELGTDIKMMGWIGASEDWVKNNPQMVQKIRAAWRQMIKELPHDKEHFKKYAKQMFGLETPEEVDLGWERARTFILPPDFEWPSKKNLEAEKQYLLGGVEAGMFPEGSEAVLDQMFVD